MAAKLLVILNALRPLLQLRQPQSCEHLTSEQRRYATAKRIYGDELHEAALRAHATYLPDTVA